MKKANSVFCGVLFAALLCFVSLAAACAERRVPPETEVAEFTLSYTAEEGGRLVGPPMQTVKKGESGAPVTAVAEDGYGFVGWSDGVETAARTDENVSKDITATAQFEKIPEYTLTYTAEEGGRIEGEGSQTVKKGESGAPVTAVAEEGYRFVGWSDGIKTAARTDENVTKNLSAAARFAKNDTVLFAGGGGTEENPYLIEEPEHLRNMEMFPAAHYRLQNDVVLSAASGGSSAFSPLFDEETMFGGVLDGNGFAIENLSIENKETFYTGLFARVGESGIVKNLTLKDATLSGTNYVGSIAGYALGKIINCSVSGTITYLAGNEYNVFLGGIAGWAENDLNGCSAQVTVTAAETEGETYAGGIAGYCAYDMRQAEESMSVSAEVSLSVTGTVKVFSDQTTKYVYAGGLFGYARNALKLADCCVRGNVSAKAVAPERSLSDDAFAGGIAGCIKAGGNSFANCRVEAEILADSADSSAYAGGIAGCVALNENGENAVTGCFSAGDVTAISSDPSSAANSYTYAGGLFGRIFYPRLTNCRTAGNVFSKTDGAAYSPACAGGMIGEIGGYNGALADCSAEGNVAAETSDDPHSHAYAGGLVGRLGSARFVNCRATGDISALAPSKDAESFAGGLAGMTRSDSAITNCYAVSRIVDNVSVNKHWGALIGSSEHIEFVNAHWLYVAESGAEYAVGYNADMGVPSGAGAVKHTAIEEFYDLADVLNEGQETPAWEHKTENALPTLISQRD